MTSIDVNYDFRNDSKDPDPDKPDSGSPILKRYHKILWSKKLPNGNLFNLSDPLKTNEYLWFQQTESSRMRLSSDWIINTYLHWDSSDEIKDIKQKIQEDELENFDRIANTIGGRIIFPLNRNQERLPETINQRRGKDKKIKDRFDLTLECIRRYYFKKENPSYNEENPLFEVICDFAYYFDLFVNFKEFCDFYLLQDLTDENYSEIKYFLLPFNGFDTKPFPKNVKDYREYMDKATKFIIARNKRIDDYVKSIKL